MALLQQVSFRGLQIYREERREINWPLEFKVCKGCKKNYFLEEKHAIVTFHKSTCTICSPPIENDSFGG
jgi:hypothetical protein